MKEARGAEIGCCPVRFPRCLELLLFPVLGFCEILLCLQLPHLYMDYFEWIFVLYEPEDLELNGRPIRKSTGVSVEIVLPSLFPVTKATCFWAPGELKTCNTLMGEPNFLSGPPTLLPWVLETLLCSPSWGNKLLRSTTFCLSN